MLKSPYESRSLFGGTLTPFARFCHNGKGNRRWRKAVKMARRQMDDPTAPSGHGFKIFHSRERGGPAIFATWSVLMVDEAQRFITGGPDGMALGDGLQAACRLFRKSSALTVLVTQSPSLEKPQAPDYTPVPGRNVIEILKPIVDRQWDAERRRRFFEGPLETVLPDDRGLAHAEVSFGTNVPPAGSLG